jgi:GxxExxY protein
MSDENEISRVIVDSAVDVHRTLGGPGLLESVYEEAMCFELQTRGLSVERQKEVPIVFKGQILASPLRIDLLVNGLVIVEVKAVTQYNSIFEAQALTHLRLTNLKLALVIYFGDRLVGSGTHRVVNGL